MASREQVTMRQPSELKRCTVAWPMPRLAPVRTTVLRCSLGILLLLSEAARGTIFSTVRILVDDDLGAGEGFDHLGLDRIRDAMRFFQRDIRRELQVELDETVLSRDPGAQIMQVQHL